VPPGSVDVPLSASTRRFLEPIVGVDPASVNVYQAPHGADATRGADAVTVGDDIVLAAGQAGESPRALGLLAHELTHVALERAAPSQAPVNAAADAQTSAPTRAIESETEAEGIDQPLARQASGAQPPDMQAATSPQHAASSQPGSASTTPNTDAPIRGQADNPATEQPPKPADDAHGEEEAAARQVESGVIAAAQVWAGDVADSSPGATARPFAAPGSDLAATHFATAAHAASTHDEPPTATAAPLTPTSSQTNFSHAPWLDAQPGDSATSNTTENLVSTPPPWDTESHATAEPQVADPWGGLPAPWQPLPEWLTSPSAFVTTVDSAGLNGVNGHTTATNGAGAGSSNGATGNNTGGNNAGGGDGGAHFADTDRSLPPPAPPSTATPTPAAPPVEPDLDALAHQVYTILKRRLASERRRLS
jgi:hypothetical protein